MTFLDYPALEQTTKNFEDKLRAEVKKKDEQIADLEERLKETQERDIRNTSSIGGQSDEIMELKKQVAYLMKKFVQPS